MNSRRLAFCSAALIACATLVAGARADEDAAALPSADGHAHGWVAVPPLSERAGLTILGHIPADAPAGTLRFGPRLRATPEALGAWENRLYIAYSPDEERRARRVESIRVERSPSPNGYDYFPRGRDPEAMPSLPGDGVLHTLRGTSAGLAALLMPDADTPARLLLLVGRVWRTVDTPEALRSATDAAIVEIAERIGLAVRDDAGVWTAWWTTKPDLTPADDEGAISPQWAPEAIETDASVDVVFSAAAHLLTADFSEPGTVRLGMVRASGAYELAELAYDGEHVALVVVGDRIALVWPGAPPDPRLHTVVVSANTGQTLYAGRALTVPIVSGRDLQTLALLLGAVALTVLVFVLRPEPVDRQIVTVPEGMALASAAARMVAVSIDVAAPVAIAATALRIEPSELFSAMILSQTAELRAAVAILLGVGVAMLHSALSEWLTGRTLGKVLTGCSTHSIKGGRPTVLQAVLRNGLKLLCPPLGMFILLDPRRRHPGDILARTVVLTKAPRTPTSD